jgi:ppGpp synthetase/RelA/SpoT-type nucleotidyltranferase
MKVSKALRDKFDEGKRRYTSLASEVKEHLQGKVEAQGWLYTGRVKELESFALKIETGRVPNAEEMEDFFGCTIIVPTLSSIEEAERFVCDQYELKERRPKEDQTTSKTASDFRFDDLRLYVARKPLASGKSPELDGAIFEVQIKTILQHAWTIATHDLIYKTDTVSWPKERIAFQVKAMLEHAEIAIAEAERLADSRGVSKKDARTDEILKIIEQVDQFWTGDAIPKNRKRLAESIRDLLKASQLEAEQLKDVIEVEKRRIGLLPRDLSPYSFVLQALFHSTTANFQNNFLKRYVRTSIVLQDGMDVPAWVGTAVRVVDLRSKTGSL